jgi:hypothetical protein
MSRFMHEAIRALVADLPPLLTRAEVAKVLRRSPRRIAQLERLGLLRAMRPCGGSPVYARAEIARILTEGQSIAARGVSTGQQVAARPTGRADDGRQSD